MAALQLVLWRELEKYIGIADAPGVYPIQGDVPHDIFRKGVHYGLIEKRDGEWKAIKPEVTTKC